MRVPRRGKPKECRFYVSMMVTGDYALRWDSDTKKLIDRTVNLFECRLFVVRKQSFHEKQKNSTEHASQSFSLINKNRTVGLLCTR
eukprot:TRINITY_DN5699_c0_g1_i3.p1 TRINITY_DN5699_c0_g1~~TRINITY_DN5699_c0_g1_i3.p1  ORF type:complete len:86 (+),score=10.09 TRINITY_DN5699_c0_g1_i3:272-529(+)